MREYNAMQMLQSPKSVKANINVPKNPLNPVMRGGEEAKKREVPVANKDLSNAPVMPFLFLFFFFFSSVARMSFFLFLCNLNRSSKNPA
ncbi:hypothetical protein K445DRAFT_264923 [Daldinia sp. EC12]|nr:hypothetical protein K445DRAFT_264923 [Daldinia sp. EC12]